MPSYWHLAQTKVALYDAFISEMEEMSTDEAYLEQHPRSLGSRPIRVLSTGYHGIHAIDPNRPKSAEQQRYEDEVARAQARWLALSSNAKQLFTTSSSEYIPFDQPDFVVDAVHQVYAGRNGGRSVPAPGPSTLDIRLSEPEWEYAVRAGSTGPTKPRWTACVLTVAARGFIPHGFFVLPRAK